jgi:hypothetical protein
MFVISLTIGV